MIKCLRVINSWKEWFCESISLSYNSRLDFHAKQLVWRICNDWNKVICYRNLTHNQYYHPYHPNQNFLLCHFLKEPHFHMNNGQTKVRFSRWKRCGVLCMKSNKGENKRKLVWVSGGSPRLPGKPGLPRTIDCSTVFGHKRKMSTHWFMRRGRRKACRRRTRSSDCVYLYLPTD